MALIDVLKKSNIQVNLSVKNEKQIIHEIAKLASQNQVLKDVSLISLETALLERENLASTALGNGVAVPHCRLPGITSFVVGIVTSKKSINFNATDNEKVDIFPFVIGPDKDPKEHLKVLSGMARLLRNPETRSKIRKADSSDQLFSIVTNLLTDKPITPEIPLGPSMRMLHIFIRNEDLFNDILQVFASEDLTGAMVLEAHESTEYMSNMPIFAGFWNSDLNTFNRIIIAVVKDSLLNQTVRNIEYVCGDLQKQTDVMVTVTDLHHAFGSLDF